ncbi:hypothetical protein E4198_17725 [Streptomyces sp. RKND-216]|uniref:hypothetical protein n=1 Tax=Streptomyces sp. RKND-216 TaxID=2562581 RepID=UPI00109DC414|nr:hypothetical protein [Streptomyces sp. RKND-216]THA26282.1 hypothetical protein E4198_17725 [Streptomyces sp. RKND-216]
MGDFLRATLEFPAVLFTPALPAVLVYWLFVLFGGVPLGTFAEGGGSRESPTAVAAAGRSTRRAFHGAPPAVVVSLLVAIAWFLSLAVTVLVPGTPLRLTALPAVLWAAWLLTRLTLRPLRRFARPEEGISHAEFVGRVCVIRTGRVNALFGQAEVAAPDGATALVQVRADDVLAPELTAGDTALIYAYDAEGGHFHVAPHDAS